MVASFTTLQIDFIQNAINFDSLITYFDNTSLITTYVDNVLMKHKSKSVITVDHTPKTPTE
jgi:hypothetical protein